jgi:hypothetical protein
MLVGFIPLVHKSLSAFFGLEIAHVNISAWSISPHYVDGKGLTYPFWGVGF